MDYARLGPETLLAGSAGTINILNLARKYNAGFLHASTSECYGDPEVHPQVESYWGRVNPIGPRSVYDEAKRFSEAAVAAWHRYYAVDTRTGPHLQHLRPAPAGQRRPRHLQLHAPGPRAASPSPSTATASRHAASATSPTSSTASFASPTPAEHTPVNIGNPTEFTMLDCAKLVLAVTGSKSEIVHQPLPQDDPARRCPDIAKARALLGWEPKVPLREGLQKSLAYFQSCLPAKPK